MQAVNYYSEFFEARGALQDAPSFEVGDQVHAKALGAPEAMLGQGGE